MQALPDTARVLAKLRETARLCSTQYSTMIEGNRLTQQQVANVIVEGQHFAGRERDENEVKGYYVALDEMERLVKKAGAVSEDSIRVLHRLLHGMDNNTVNPTPHTALPK